MTLDWIQIDGFNVHKKQQTPFLSLSVLSMTPPFSEYHNGGCYKAFCAEIRVWCRSNTWKKEVLFLCFYKVLFSPGIWITLLYFLLPKWPGAIFEILILTLSSRNRTITLYSIWSSVLVKSCEVWIFVVFMWTDSWVESDQIFLPGHYSYILLKYIKFYQAAALAALYKQDFDRLHHFLYVPLFFSDLIFTT